MKIKTIIVAAFLLHIYTGGIVDTTAQSWERIGLDSLVILHLYIAADTIYAGAADMNNIPNLNSGLYYSIDSGDNWIQLDSLLGDGAILGLERNTDNTLYIIKCPCQEPQAGTLYKTQDNGNSWEEINSVIQWFGVSPFNKNEMYFIDVLRLPAGISNNLYKSTDGGNRWANISAFPSSSHGSALAFAFDLIDSMNLYVTVDTQFDQYLYKSTNKGENWNYVSEPPVLPWEIKTDLFLTDRIYLYAYYKATNDGGLNWYDAYTGLSNNIDYLSFYQDKETTKLLYNLRRDGLYSSRNDSIHWSMVDGSEELPIYSGPTGFYLDRDMCNIFIEPESKELFLGTAEGIYKTAIITNVNEDDKRYLDFSLSQNYPNPFNPTTTIEYQIPSVGQDGILTNNVKLKVYDILGKEVAVLVNEVQAPGTYKIEFNGEGLPSGIFFYKFEAGSSSIVRKMLLLK